MKVSELIKALSERPQDAEVFFVENGKGMYEISKVRTAHATGEDARTITGEEFVIIE